MIKEENKRFIITFSHEELEQLESLSKLHNMSKSDLLNCAFKAYLMGDNSLSDRTIRVMRLLDKNPHINIKFVNDLFVLYCVGLDDHLKILVIDDVFCGVEDLEDDKELIDQINYFLLVA